MLAAENAERANTPEFDYSAWVRGVEALRQQIRASQGDKQPFIDVVGLLRDIREGKEELLG